MSSTALNIAIILTAYDKASRVINDAVDKSNKKMKDMRDKAQKASAQGAMMIGAGAAMAAPLIEATQAAIGFEDKMADVAKVMNLTVGSSEFTKMSNDTKDLAQYLGKAGEEAAGLNAALASGGVAKEDMKAVGIMAGEMGVAFGMGSEDAGKAFIKIRNALGVTIPEAKKVGDAINYLSDSMASEASEIVNFMSSGGSSVAASFRIGGKEAAAFGSSLISLGKSSSESATIFERFAKGIFKDAGLKKIFDKAGGGDMGLVAVLEAGMKSKDKFNFFKKFGEYGSDVQLLASTIGNKGGLKDALKGLATESNFAGSVTKEFANRNSTAQGGINRMKSSVDILKVTLGEAFLPAVKSVSKVIGEVVGGLANWFKENPRVAKTLGYAVAAASGFLILAGAFKIVRAAMILMKIAAMSNPIILIATGIALVVGAIIANWDNIGPFFVKLWAGVKRIFSASWNWIKSNIIYVLNPGLLIFKHWDKIVGFFKGLWERAKAPFIAIWEWFKGIHVKMFEAGKNLIGGIIKGITAKATELMDKVKGVAKKIRDFFPFSPAKEGPLRDIHKIRLVETIADSIRPNAMVRAVSGVVRATANAFGGGPSLGDMNGGGGGSSITYAPTIYVGAGVGPSAKADFMAMLKTHSAEIMRLIKSEQDKKARVSF